MHAAAADVDRSCSRGGGVGFDCPHFNSNIHEHKVKIINIESKSIGLDWN